MKRTHYSKQRELIIDFISNAEQAPAGDEIFYALKEDLKDISRSTVFRNLNFLVGQKTINKVVTPSGPARYEIANNKSHAICEKCGKNITFELESNIDEVEELLKEVYKKTNIKSTMKGINFMGICTQCAKNIRRKKRNE